MTEDSHLEYIDRELGGLNEQILRLSKAFGRRNHDITTGVGLQDYTLSDLQHSLDHIARRVNESEVMRTVLNGTHTYQQETSEIFSFYTHKEWNSLPKDYQERLDQLIHDLNGLQLGTPQDFECRNQENLWHELAANQLSLKEIDILTDETTQRELRTVSFLGLTFRGKLEHRFGHSYQHLETRSRRADKFLGSVGMLYKELQGVHLDG